MTTPDLINGSFEILGSAMTWMNVKRILKDRGYGGIYPPAVAFFWSWGLWNLYFYPHLDQWLSFAGGISLVLANTTWIVLLLKFGKLPSRES